MSNLRKKSLAVTLIAVMSIAWIPSIAQEQQDEKAAESKTMEQRVAAVKPEKTIIDDRVRADVVVVKFREGARVRLQSGQLTANSDARSESEKKLLERANINQDKLAQELNTVSNLLQSDTSLRIERLFTASEETLDSQKQEGEAKSNKELADLNLYYNILIENADASRSEQLINQLNALEIIEIAYPQPIFKPAQLDIPPVTPDFTGSQGYLNAAPQGIDANHARHHAGGRGDGIRVMDVEGGWTLNHEDLRPSFFQAGVFSSDPAWENHGTAVLGEIVGAENGYGVTGIAPQAEFGVSSIWRCFIFCWQETANAINVGASQLRAGDILLVELHGPGPASGEVCRDNCGQFEFVPAEFWQADFDAISNATARGIVVVEAAGNGSMNLDHARYNGVFNRFVRDSGAILVGAGMSGDRSPHIWSNAGSRVDVQGWGDSVMTLGYGSAFNPGDTRQLYTNGFSGTSSASPIVVGAAAVVQGIRRHRGLSLLTSVQMRVLLTNTGTSQAPNVRRIGPLPNLRAAIAATPAASPMGVLDGVDASGDAWGWTLDPDVQANPIYVHFYVDGPFGVGTWAGVATANAPRPDVNQATGYPGNHGFNFRLPAQFIDGRAHTLYAYGIDATGNNNVLLAASGRSFIITANRNMSINVQSHTIALPGQLTETISVHAADSVSGEVLNGTVTVNGSPAGQTGQFITYTHSRRECSFRRCYIVRDPVHFTVNVPGYNTATFTR